MRIILQIGATIMVAGLLLVAAGGISVHRGPDGIWVQVNLVHAVGGVLLLCGMLLAVIATFASGRLEKGRAVDPSEPNR